MPKLLLITVSLLVCLTLKAQLPNASFEQTDSLGKIAYWKSIQGKTTQLTSTQFGVIPFTAYEGNFFVLLESDTQTAIVKKGILAQTFAFADTPGSFSFHYFYIPESITQHAQIELLLSKWNGSTRDTVLYFKDTIAAVADSNQIRIQWNTWSANFKNKYNLSILPDSATIQFQNDDAATPGKTVRLYLDDLRFSPWSVGLHELKNNNFSIYPNPANDIMMVEGAFETTPYFELIGIDGKHYPLHTDGITADRRPDSYRERTADNTNVSTSLKLNIQTIPNGFYVLRINTTTTSFTKRILINHEQ